jgi:alpha-1,3-rhamnosyltransferase
MEDNFLVTVRVLSYNSSRTVLETLDSIYNQTYQNIELIVSDDASVDNTVELVKQWLADKTGRFTNVQLLTVKENTGTSANINRTLAVAKGKWIKGVAADDVLFPNAIEKYVGFVHQNPTAKWVYAKAKCYKYVFSEENIFDAFPNLDKRLKNLNNLNSAEQLQYMCYHYPYYYPTQFVLKELYMEVGGCDEEFRNLDDFPLWFRFYRHGERCFFMDEYVMGYRFSDRNLSVNLKSILNKKLVTEDYKMKKKYMFDICPRRVRIDARLKYGVYRIFSIPAINNRPSLFLPLFRFVIRIIIFPNWIWSKITKLKKRISL